MEMDLFFAILSLPLSLSLSVCLSVCYIALDNISFIAGYDGKFVPESTNTAF